MMTWSSMNFQNANSPIMEQLIFFHDYTMIISILITVSILYLMLTMMLNKFTNKNLFYIN